MGDAAHAESLDHEVYRTPLAVEPEIEYRYTPIEYRYTPDDYSQLHLGTDELPDKIKVWRVQNSDRNSVVSRGYGFTDSPDAEILALGFNRKEYGAVGIGRHGNYLEWGYSDPPSQMTEAGRNLFINCVHYIRRFEGVIPLVRRQNSHRLNAMRLADAIDSISGDRKKFFLRNFPEELYEAYHSDPKGLTAHYRENIEWVYRDGAFRVDRELKSLGIDSNREIDSLRRLIELLEDGQQEKETVRTLLARYTSVSFETAQQWQQWFDENKDRLYFSDVGGYRFRVVPQGYGPGQ
jgi:hypothetical protein